MRSRNKLRIKISYTPPPSPSPEISTDQAEETLAPNLAAAPAPVIVDNVEPDPAPNANQVSLEVCVPISEANPSSLADLDAEEQPGVETEPALEDQPAAEKGDIVNQPRVARASRLRPPARLKRHQLIPAALAVSALTLGLALHWAPAGAVDEDTATVSDGPSIVDIEELPIDFASTDDVDYQPSLTEISPEAVFVAAPLAPGFAEPEPYVPEPEIPEPVWEPQPWNIYRGPNWTDRVLLTYDDCMNDPERFIAVLDHATELNIGLLLFPTGNCVIMYRNLFDIDLPQAIRERGHWMGNHSISHPHLTQVNHNELMRQISWPESNLLRPPFGSWNQRVHDAAASIGMRLVMWNLDTQDWRGTSEQGLIDLIVNYANPGDNVLLHFQHQGFTQNALSGIQQGLRERGIELCRPAPPDQRPTPTEVPENIC